VTLIIRHLKEKCETRPCRKGEDVTICRNAGFEVTDTRDTKLEKKEEIKGITKDKQKEEKDKRRMIGCNWKNKGGKEQDDEADYRTGEKLEQEPSTETECRCQLIGGVKSTGGRDW